MRVLLPLAARRSHRVIVISRSTRDDVVRHMKVAPGKIDVVPQGLGSPVAAEPLPEAEVRARNGLSDRRVVLSVSAKRPHKNLLRLLEALALIDAERRPVLVLPGYPTWHEAELRARAAELSLDEDVRFLGWVDQAELEGLYRAASCFVFPSLYEGFGMPVLEAMRRGLPVACSDRASLPEVAGDAALHFDPERPVEIAAAVERLLTDADLAERLRTAGAQRAARFTWRETARGTLASYERTLAMLRRP